MMLSGGGDLGLNEFLHHKLKRFRATLSERTRKTLVSFITHTVYIFSIAGPVMTLPQAAQIYANHTVAGLSFVTWGSYLFLAFFWFGYGILIKNKPIILANSLSILVNLSIIVGMILYS